MAQPWAGGRNPVGIPGTEARDETPKYKASSVEWLGDVPEHCEVKRIKYSASVNDETLAETTEATELEAQFEREFAQNPTYIHMYRYGNAYHGVHPFYMWYWGAHAMDYLGDVIFVGADRRAVRRMGFRTASNFADACPPSV